MSKKGTHITVNITQEWLFDQLKEGQAKAVFVAKDTLHSLDELGTKGSAQDTDFESVVIKCGKRKLTMAHIRTDVVNHGYTADYADGQRLRVKGDSYRLYVAPMAAVAGDFAKTKTDTNDASAN